MDTFVGRFGLVYRINALNTKPSSERFSYIIEVSLLEQGLNYYSLLNVERETAVIVAHSMFKMC